jgi:hypothetical protein
MFQLCISLLNISSLYWNKNTENINVWWLRLRDAAGERRPPNTTRTKYVPQTLNPMRLEDGLGDATRNALTIIPTGNLSRICGVCQAHWFSPCFKFCIYLHKLLCWRNKTLLGETVFSDLMCFTSECTFTTLCYFVLVLSHSLEQRQYGYTGWEQMPRGENKMVKRNTYRNWLILSWLRINLFPS